MRYARTRRTLDRLCPPSVRHHPFLVAALAAVLIGGGLRLAPASTAALPGTTGGVAGASTACTAS